jgi:hypothetical protein
MSAPTAVAGVVDDLPDDQYHAQGALSSSGARTLLKPGGPAIYAWRRAHPEPHKSAYDLGHAAHLQVLGAGPKVVVVDAADWRTKAAKEQREAAYAEGAVPLLREQYWGVREMASALASHPLAGPLLNPDHGVAEQSLFWTDPATGVPCRARIDWRTQLADGRTVVVDYKTTHSAAPDALARAVAEYGYHTQGAFYLDGARTLGLADDDAVFLLIAQEKTPPYLASVRQLDAAAMRIGHADARRAREMWRDCTAAGTWPGYPVEVEFLSLPPWFENQHAEEYAA